MIENEIEKGNQDKQHISIIEDVNCKIGNKIKGNDNTITKWWENVHSTICKI